MSPTQLAGQVSTRVSGQWLVIVYVMATMVLTVAAIGQRVKFRA